jgi:hypoxanthine-DNA glycosylase
MSSGMPAQHSQNQPAAGVVDMDKSEGFAAITSASARVLILGSLPGRKSLAEEQYYAHPQNLFWPIMRELFDIKGSYDERCSQLGQHQIALWDVLGASVRPGSMDADIRTDTAEANDFEGFLSHHPDVEMIAFNGRKAGQLFARLAVLPHDRPVRTVSLPSTSPAYASMSKSDKVSAWRTGLSAVLPIPKEDKT